MGLDELKKKQIVLIIIPKSKYASKLKAIVKAVDAASKKICYVNLNKPYNSILEDLKKDKFKIEKYFFVDVLTSSVQTPPKADNCEFVQSPSALTDISLAFTKAMQEKKCDNALFDTISTLTIYQDTGEIIKFAHSLITKARVSNVKSVYLILKEDGKELVKDLVMFVDSVIEIK